MSNILTTSELKKYRNEVNAQIAADPTMTGTELKALLDTFDDAQRENRYNHTVSNLKNTKTLSGDVGGSVSLSVTIATAGADYLVGDTFPITGGEGTGAGVKVTAINGSGAITAVQVTNVGIGYVTPVVDLSGSGDTNGELTLTASAVTARNEATILDEMLAATYP